MIILIFFIIIVMIFTFLYIEKQQDRTGGGLIKTTGEAGSFKKTDEALTPAETEEQKDATAQQAVEAIIEQGKNKFGGASIDAIKSAEAVANQRLQEKLNSRTPEQIKADQKQAAEIQKMLEEANSKMK